jgi:hypothetical protein
MKKNLILVLVALVGLASSCNIAKTCPTYAKAKNTGIPAESKR